MGGHASCSGRCWISLGHRCVRRGTPAPLHVALAAEEHKMGGSVWLPCPSARRCPADPAHNALENAWADLPWGGPLLPG